MDTELPWKPFEGEELGEWSKDDDEFVRKTSEIDQSETDVKIVKNKGVKEINVENK